MIHAGEILLEERGAIELLHSAMHYLADSYSDGCEWRELHHMAAHNLLREKVISIQVDVCSRRPA